MTFNRERAVDYMSRYNLDVLVATSSTTITYFSDNACWLDSKFKQYMMMPGAPDHLIPTTTFVVFPVNGVPALVIDAQFAVNAIASWEISPQRVCLHQIFNLIPNAFFFTLWTKQNIIHNQ